MSVRDMLCVAAIGLIAYPIICVIFSTCVEIWFNRKEKHIIWCEYSGKGTKMEDKE